jgi:hypothetical protein
VKGIELSRAYFTEVVEPIIADRFPSMPFAAGRLGTGSDVLGMDDATSRDHDWGLRLSLFVPGTDVFAVNAALDAALPERFRGHPTRFAFTGETDRQHQIDVASVSEFVTGRLGFDPRAGISVRDWLSLSGQAVLEVTAGPVFVDGAGELESARRALEWYPDDIWRYVLACDWTRISQELPLMGRAADVGDDRGSRIIAARLAHVVMHLSFLIERRWPPYAKWFGTAFEQLACAGEVGDAIDLALSGSDAGSRQRGLADAVQIVVERQNALGLTKVETAIIPFWDRPYVHPDPAVVAQLLGGIEDAEVQRLPAGRGSVEQRTDNVDVLVSATARRAAIA